MYRRWFYAAAIYNAVWGIAVVLCPGPILRMAGLDSSGASPLVQVMGMMVGVYAYGYYLLARAEAVLRPHLDWTGGEDARTARVPLQRGGQDAALGLWLDLYLQRLHLVAVFWRFALRCADGRSDRRRQARSFFQLSRQRCTIGGSPPLVAPVSCSIR